MFALKMSQLKTWMVIYIPKTYFIIIMMPINMAGLIEVD